MSIRIGGIGLAHPHIYGFLKEALQEPATCLVGFAEKEKKFIKRAVSTYSEAPVYKTAEELLTKEKPDIVIISSINSDKADNIIKCLKAGITVVVDKPLVTTLKDLESIERCINETGNKNLHLMLSERYNTPLYTAKKLIDAGEIGKIINIISMRPHRLAPEKRPDSFFREKFNGGIINDLIIHDIDIIRWFTETDVDKILSATTGSKRYTRYKEFNEFGDVSLRMRDGSTAYIKADWLTPDAFPFHGDCRVIVTGTKGQIEIFTLDEKVIMFSDREAPKEADMLKRPINFSQDVIRHYKEPKHNTATSLEDVIEATKLSLSAQNLAYEISEK